MQDELTALGAATVAESGGRPLPPGLDPVWSGGALAAPALTVWCPDGDNLAVHHAVALVDQPVALVVSVGGTPERGWWGEVLTVAAQAAGVEGLVIDACVRDTAAIRARRFPVWARGIALPGTAKVTAGRIGAPVVVNGCSVSTGDWVVADDDGVVIVDAARLEPVTAAARDRADREAHLFDQLVAGHTTVELLGLDPPA